MIQQESYKGRLIETSGKMPTRNPADKVHYIVRFRDWRLAHSVTLALDVPKKGTIGSGELENKTDVCWHSSLPSPFRAYPKENPVPLGREYLNRPNRPPWISLLRNKTMRIRLGQLECVLSVWEILN